MQILIVDHVFARAGLWRAALERLGATVEIAGTQDRATDRLRGGALDLLVLNLDLADGGAFAVADYAGFRRPELPVICVSGSRFFSAGGAFRLCANARVCLPDDTRADDLAEIAHHFGMRAA